MGCHRQWADIKQTNLQTIGISPSHAREVITSATQKSLIVQNGNKSQYKLGNFRAASTVRAEKLRRLIGKNLIRSSSQKGNSFIAKPVTYNFPDLEFPPAQYSNVHSFPKQEVLRSSDDQFGQPKDNDKDNFKETDKETGFADKKLQDPNSFMPTNASQAAALEAWKALEPDQPGSFGIYLHFVKLGLVADMFHRFMSEIRQDPTIKNKGAVFNKKASEYLASKAMSNG